MGIEAGFHRFEQWLQGQPDRVLTAILLLVAAALIVIALRASALEKAVVASWVLFP